MEIQRSPPDFTLRRCCIWKEAISKQILGTIEWIVPVEEWQLLVEFDQWLVMEDFQIKHFCSYLYHLKGHYGSRTSSRQG
jgi:hypothetical protein